MHMQRLWAHDQTAGTVLRDRRRDRLHRVHGRHTGLPARPREAAARRRLINVILILAVAAGVWLFWTPAGTGSHNAAANQPTPIPSVAFSPPRNDKP